MIQDSMYMYCAGQKKKKCGFTVAHSARACAHLPSPHSFLSLLHAFCMASLSSHSPSLSSQQPLWGPSLPSLDWSGNPLPFVSPIGRFFWIIRFG